MDRLDLQTAAELIDFGGKGAIPQDLAQLQLEGSVALHNMLAEHGMAYLADEVGMGKTYIALGVVALMRRFQPGLRVLYLLPKNNVRDKWQKDYRSFVDKNLRMHDGIVKGFGSAPAAPFRSCSSLSNLVQAVATDSVRDYFVCTSAFSLPLGGTRTDLADALERFRRELPQNAAKVDQLLAQLQRPGLDDSRLQDLKREAKRCWAGALNAILPQFDVVVVDEAHNYRRGLHSADRNQLLATVLGTDSGAPRRVDRVLLLSATPFDRDIGQLRRQLELFGKEALLDVADGAPWERVHAALRPFMVRRLNSLKLGEKEHTRNMYRTEHRCGEKAEIVLGLKQQLFAALLQKKVSESLNENNSGKFELGMLASFESYLPSNRGMPVQFDGAAEQAGPAGSSERDAPDRTVVELLVDDYQKHFGEFPPHPKMDHVGQQAARSAFASDRKQLIFVRRVGSVGELKAKIEDSYNRWIGNYVRNDPEVARWFRTYSELVGERQHGQLDEERDGDKSSLSSFFAWFYRGDNELVASAGKDLVSTPSNFRNVLASASMMFATSWSRLPGMPCPQKVDFGLPVELPALAASPTRIQNFERAQYAYLSAVALGAAAREARVARRILATAFSDVVTVRGRVDIEGLADTAGQRSLWDVLRTEPALECLGRKWSSDTFDTLAGDDEMAAEQLIRETLVHHRLAAAVCRLDHPFVDLYALRASRARVDEGSADDRLIHSFAGRLLEQSGHPNTFSSFQILRDLAANLELLLKQNFEDIDEKKPAEFTQYITRQLHPLSPVLGATGENSGSRSAIARKFRMPGYPRVLVSTDVFQEGEDLHTFCDSVVHYGISASPISLEQKVGRVDRIGSLAHRNMRPLSHGHAQHFIQVSFPHIRESLEFLQVRQAARNLNQFLLSMNRVGEKAPCPSTEVLLAQELLDRSPIEPAIAERLTSPFQILPPMLGGADRRSNLQHEQAMLDARIAHGRRLVETVLSDETGCQVRLVQRSGRLQWDGPNGLSVALRGVHGRPHLLLSVSAPDAGAIGMPAFGVQLVPEDLRRMQASPLVRLHTGAEAAVALRHTPRRNAEIYAGTADVLCDAEVQDLYRRVADPCWNGTSASIGTQALQERIDGLEGPHGAWSVVKGSGNVLDFHFHLEQSRQRVQWTLYGNYLLFTAQVLAPDQTADLGSHPGQLLLHTLQRNTVFDMVDFHIDSSLALSVRAMHPLYHLNHEELAFTASMVACEADRLRQILLANPEDDDQAEDDEEAELARARTVGRLRRWAEDSDAMCVVRDVLAAGPMTPAELIRQTAYGLGYRHATPGIRTALDGVLLAAARRGIIIRETGTVRLLARSITEYEDDHLKTQFLAALSRESAGLVERPDAVRAFARWMGYARTGPVIAGVGASLIRKLLRADRLVASGSQIQRNRP